MPAWVKLALLFCAAAAPLVTEPVLADDVGAYVTAGGGMVGGVPTVVVGSVGGSGGSGGLGGGGLWCVFRSVDVRLLLAPVVSPVVGVPYVLECRDGLGVVSRELLVYDPVSPVVAQRAAQLAVAQLGVPAPVVRTSPPEWSPLVVGLETWLWVESWVSYSASASLGGVRATVTATPVSARFVTGDGGEVTCVGGGVPYDRSRSPEGQSSGCVHVYERRSTVSDPAGIYTLAVTVTYEVVWSASSGQGGQLEPLTRSASIPVQVLESQPVIR